MPTHIHSYILAAAACLAPLWAAGQERPDTLINVSGASRVAVTETPRGMTVSVSGVDGDPLRSVTYTQDFGNTPAGRTRTTRSVSRSLPFTLPGDCGCNDEKDRRVDGIISGFGIGLSEAYKTPRGYNLEMGHSLQITWPMILGVRVRLASTNSLAVGVGVGWRNYKSTSSEACMMPNSEGGVGLAPFPDVADPMSSRIKVFSLQFPVVFSQYLGFRWPGGGRARLSLGAILNWNSHASLENAWRDLQGNVVRQNFEGIHQRKFSVDPYMSIAFGALSVYAQYSPMTVLHSHGSPEMRPLTIGLGLGMP